MITVGIDLSLLSTGMVIFNNGKESIHIIKTKAGQFGRFERYNYITKQIFDILSDSKVLNELDMVAIEGYSLYSKGDAMSRAIENGAKLRFTMLSNKVPFIEVAPQTLKAFTTGVASADKQRVIESVRKKASKDFLKKFEDLNKKQKEDVADAYVLAEIAEYCLINSSKLIDIKSVKDKDEKRLLRMCKKLMEDHIY